MELIAVSLTFFGRWEVQVDLSWYTRRQRKSMVWATASRYAHERNWRGFVFARLWAVALGLRLDITR